MHKVDHTHMNLRLIRKKKKTGIKGFFFSMTVTILPYPAEQRAWHCPHCKKVLMWMDAEE